MTRIMEALQARAERVKKGDKGFTLIELLVVVIIIGILAAIAIPVYIGVQNNAKESAVKSDLGNLKTAEVAYYTNNNNYVTGTGTALAVSSLSSNGYSQSDAANYSGTNTPKVYAPTTANGTFCIQAVAATGNSFAVSDAHNLAAGQCGGTGNLVWTTGNVSANP